MTPWWQRSIIYHMVVPSFFDSNDDGLGDLAGVIARLDYLAWLGVRALWLSPIYASPFRDLGYDVSDFTAIDARFGTLATFDELLREAHRRDIRLILDWVPAHTSSEHPWFRESSSARDSARRDWYIWRDAAPGGGPPNNWISVFGGSAWTWHEPTRQHYLHTFHSTQPDLNWRNPAVRAAMLDTLRFWLDRGVDGFRIDACCLLLKDEQLRDNPPNPNFKENIDGPDSKLLSTHTRNQPGLHEVLAEIRAVIESYDDRVLLGEIYLPLDNVLEFYGRPERPELHLPLYMNLTWTGWNAAELGATIGEYQAAVSEVGWPIIVLASHDSPRIVARAGAAQARVAAMLLLTLRGTATLYYGEEIGMQGVEIPRERARDPQGRRTGRNRDPHRTPMQWNAHQQNAGFSRAKPWLPVAEDVAACNVLAQSDVPGSLLSLYRDLLRLRAQSPALTDGRFEAYDAHAPDVFAFRRVHDSQTLLIVLNLSDETRETLLGDEYGTLTLSTEGTREPGTRIGGRIALKPAEGLIVTLGD